MVPGRGCGQVDRRSFAPPGARRHPHRRRQFLLRGRHPPRQGTGLKANPLCRCRHQRRRLGAGARLLHDDRRRDASRHALDPIFKTLAPGPAISRAPRAATSSAAPPRRAICTAAPTAPAISSRWSTTASSTASWPPMPRASAFCEHANVGKQQHEIDAETTPLRDPEHYQYDLNLRDITEVWRRGSVIASWLLDLTASGARQRSDALGILGPGLRFGEGPDDQGRHRRRRARPRFLPPPCTSASLRAARPTSPTRCSRPCVSRSAGTSRNRNSILPSPSASEGPQLKPSLVGSDSI